MTDGRTDGKWKIEQCSVGSETAIRSTSVYLQVVENKYQPGIPEREALQDWDLREVVSFKFVFTFFSDPFTDLFDFPINSRYQDLDLNKEIFHKFCFTAMILMLTFMM